MKKHDSSGLSRASRRSQGGGAYSMPETAPGSTTMRRRLAASSSPTTSSCATTPIADERKGPLRGASLGRCGCSNRTWWVRMRCYADPGLAFLSHHGRPTPDVGDGVRLGQGCDRGSSRDRVRAAPSCPGGGGPQEGALDDACRERPREGVSGFLDSHRARTFLRGESLRRVLRTRAVGGVPGAVRITNSPRPRGAVRSAGVRNRLVA